MCKAHDFKEMTWRHLNFFQHHAYITADVARTDCPDCGVKRITVPWARQGSRFTLLFEQVALSLVREMPVNAAARHMAITDKSLWRVVDHYVSQAIAGIDLSGVAAVALDETAAKRGQNDVTVFIDLERGDNPVIFATPGKDQAALARFCEHLKAQGGSTDGIWEVVCDMSQAFQVGVGEMLPNASLTTDWFHVVGRVTDAMNAVRKAETRALDLPKGARPAQGRALGHPQRRRARPHRQPKTSARATASDGHRHRRRLRDQGKATMGARRSHTASGTLGLTRFLNLAKNWVGETPLLEPMRTALATIEYQFESIIQRWHSSYSNARLEGLNSIFQAARARACGDRNRRMFITMIYLLAAPIGDIAKST
jgi:transposase